MRVEPTYYTSLEPAKRLNRRQVPLLIIGGWVLNGSVGSVPGPMAWLIFQDLLRRKMLVLKHGGQFAILWTMLKGETHRWELIEKSPISSQSKNESWVVNLISSQRQCKLCLSGSLGLELAPWWPHIHKGRRRGNPNEYAWVPQLFIPVADYPLPKSKWSKA